MRKCGELAQLEIFVTRDVVGSADRRKHLRLLYSVDAEICFEVGFNNVSNFNRQFLALKGMPPSKFRALRRDGTRIASAA